MRVVGGTEWTRERVVRELGTESEHSMDASSRRGGRTVWLDV